MGKGGNNKCERSQVGMDAGAGASAGVKATLSKGGAPLCEDASSEHHRNANGSAGGMRYFHTTNAKLRPGDIIEPAAKRRYRSKHRKLPHYDPNYVYVWDGQNSRNAVAFRHHGNFDYEVEPLGSVEPDTELTPAPPGQTGKPWPGAWRTTHARVVREVPDAWGELTEGVEPIR